MKIKFYLGTGFSSCEHEEIFDYEDDVTDDEIDKDYEDWKNDRIDCSWWKVEE